MKTFKDNKNRDWIIDINVDSIKQVRALVDVNLLDVISDNKLIARLQDPVLLVDVIYALCKDQADKANVTDREFGVAMRGDAIDAATQALLEDLTDFFPKGKREIMSKAMLKLNTLQGMMMAEANRRLDSNEAEERLQKLMQRSLSDSSTDLPESAASIPAK